MTPATLAQCLDIPLARAELWAAPVAEAFRRFSIGTVARQAAFLGNLGVESGALRYVRELWQPTPAQLGYDKRADLGNTSTQAIAYAALADPPDRPGHFYRGLSPMQVTGYFNILAGSRAVFGDDRLAAHPTLGQAPLAGMLLSGWFWQWKHCNELADPGTQDAFVATVHRVNGGENGLAERLRYWDMTRRALSAPGAG